MLASRAINLAFSCLGITLVLSEVHQPHNPDVGTFAERVDDPLLWKYHQERLLQSVESSRSLDRSASQEQIRVALSANTNLQQAAGGKAERSLNVDSAPEFAPESAAPGPESGAPGASHGGAAAPGAKPYTDKGLEILAGLQAVDTLGRLLGQQGVPQAADHLAQLRAALHDALGPQEETGRLLREGLPPDVRFEGDGGSEEYFLGRLGGRRAAKHGSKGLLSQREQSEALWSGVDQLIPQSGTGRRREVGEWAAAVRMTAAVEHGAFAHGRAASGALQGEQGAEPILAGDLSGAYPALQALRMLSLGNSAAKAELDRVQELLHAELLRRGDVAGLQEMARDRELERATQALQALETLRMLAAGERHAAARTHLREIAFLLDGRAGVDTAKLLRAQAAPSGQPEAAAADATRLSDDAAPSQVRHAVDDDALEQGKAPPSSEEEEWEVIA